MNVLFFLTYALIALGLLSITLAEIISWPVFLGIGILVACSPWRDRLRLNFSRRTMNVAVLVALGIFLWGTVTGGFRAYIPQLLYFTLALLIAKLYGPKAHRDHLQILLICTFYLVAASIKLASLSFLAVILVFLPLALAHLMILNLRRDAAWCAAGGASLAPLLPTTSQPAAEYALPDYLRRAFGWPSLGHIFRYFLFVLVLSIAGFYLIPRFTLQMFAHEQELVEISTGFAESVELGDLGEIISNDTPVMKVFIEGPQPSSRVGLRWRGITLDAFDGTSWRVSPKMRDLERYEFPQPSGLAFHLGGVETANAAQRFELRPINTPMVFVQPEALSVSLERISSPMLQPRPSIYSLRLQPLAGNLFFSPVDRGFYARALKAWLERNPEGPINERRFRNRLPRNQRFHQTVAYRVLSRVASPQAEPLRLASGDDPEPIRQFYLQLPNGLEPIRRLAQTVVEGQRNRYDQAEAIELFLRREYEYTLVPEPGVREMSLEQFLLDVRRGHCEYFSSAMGVMLRTLGIPARVVNGFVASEFNRFGDYYQVRQSDAHSWVEVFFPGYGWVPFDPTPPQRGGGFHLGRTLRQMFDLVQAGWVEYVVDFSFHQQRRLFGSIYDFLKPSPRWAGPVFSLRSAGSSGGSAFTRGLGFLVVIVAAAVGVWWLRFRRRCRSRKPDLPQGDSRRDARSAILFYERLLKILARKGFNRRPGQTPRELAGAVAAAAPRIGEPAGEMTELYYAVRFGRQTLSPSLRERLLQLLREVRKQSGA